MQDVLNYDAYGYGPTPYPQPIMGPECDRIAGLSISTSVPGLWLADCQAVSNLNIVGAALMPWNMMRTRVGTGGDYPPTTPVNPMLLQDQAPLISGVPYPSGSYVVGTPCEQQAEPPPWKASTYFPANFTILDPSGNYQKSGSPGVSGVGPPSWQNGGPYTYDNWTPGPGIFPGGVPIGLTWHLIKALSLPKLWQSMHTYNVGDSLLDENGNTQTVISTIRRSTAYAVYPTTPYQTDGNNNFQQCVTAGTTGGETPAWNLTLNGLTTDGSAVWKLVRLNTGEPTSGITEPAWPIEIGATVQDEGVLWQTTAHNRVSFVTPAQHRIPDIPRYPVYWSSETLARLKPPTSGSGLTIWGANNQWQRNPTDRGGYDTGWQQDNLAYGWWIYSVSLNRCQYPTKTRGPVSSSEFGAGGTAPGAGDAGASGAGAGGPGSGSTAGPVLDSSEISVTIGCMRVPPGGGAAVFVAFGSYMTGGTYQVYWPVFTSYALVYEASERVDVQAMAINNTVICAAQIPAPGAALVAAFVTDTEALLNLI